MGERIDRAQAMIEALPAEGAVVIAITNEVARWLMTGIVAIRGKEFAKTCRVVGIHRMSSVGKIIGERRPVMLHHSFVEHAKADVTASVAGIVAGINAMHPSLEAKNGHSS